MLVRFGLLSMGGGKLTILPNKLLFLLLFMSRQWLYITEQGQEMKLIEQDNKDRTVTENGTDVRQANLLVYWVY